MKKTERIITIIILSLSIIVTMFGSPFSIMAASSSDLSDTSWQSKISPDLFEKAETKDDKYLVSIFRQSIPDDAINKAVLQKTGYSVDLYESESFYTQVAPVIQKQLEEKDCFEKTLLNDNRASSSISEDALEIALRQEMDRYIAAKRSVIKDLNTEQNALFLSKKIMDLKDIVYQSKYTSLIIAYVTPQQIKEISLDQSVTHILPSTNISYQVEYDVVMPQIQVDDTSGSKSALFNSNQGFWGDGIKIGIIEADNGICNVDHPQLQSAYNNEKLHILTNSYIYQGELRTVSPTISNHATEVTSLILGAPLTNGNKSYCGVVPNATVYQIPMYDGPDLCNAVETLVDYGVTIINFSGGWDNGGAYEVSDQYIDYLVESLGITFVKSAGNEGLSSNPYITSPGKAYNVITVGNAYTKTSKDNAAISPYSIDIESSYSENDYLTNKPDIVAPGSWFTFPSISHDITPSGTSFSAPLVAGVAAQIHQSNLVCKTNSTLTKAILLAGADFGAVKSVNNETCIPSGYARERSGVGFLNAVNSINIAINSTYGYSNVNLKQHLFLESYVRRFSVTIPANATIRVVLTYEKAENIPLTSRYENDLDVHLCNSNGELVAYSSGYDNVEVFEYTATQLDTYWIEVHFYHIIPSDVSLFMNVGVAWRLIPN